jgi:hypothetical protein
MAASFPVVLPSDQTISATVQGNITASSYPDPAAYLAGVTDFLFDAFNNLQVRGTVLTDEESFRDDFGNGATSLLTTLTGTVAVTSGGTTLTGTGTAFLTELDNQSYFRISSHANSALTRVASVESDTSATLVEGYLGATSAGAAAVQTEWLIRTDGTTSVTVGSSVINLIGNTTSGNTVQIAREGDFLPFVLTMQLLVNTRVANVEAAAGFFDLPPTPEQQACVVFNGTDNTKAIFRTSFSSNASDIQESLVTLPSGTTATQHAYEINLGPNLAALAIDGTIVATHALHLPKPYHPLQIAAYVENTGVPASATTLTVDAIFFQNLDTVNVGNIFRAEPFGVQLLGKATTTGQLQGVNTDGNGNLQVITSAVPTTSSPGIAFGDPTLAAIAQAPVRRNVYNEQAANFTGSIRSSSANDTAAGTGARTVRIYWMNATGTVSGTEDVTLNGTTAVNLVTTTKCFIEKMEVLTAGSGGVAAGAITLFSAAAAGGTAVSIINTGDNQTYYAHHYVLSGKTCNVTGTLIGSTSTVAGNDCVFVLKAKSLTLANAIDKQISDFLTLFGQSSQVARNYGSYVQVAGPARVLMYATPVSGASTTFRGSFDYYDI